MIVGSKDRAHSPHFLSYKLSLPQVLTNMEAFKGAAPLENITLLKQKPILVRPTEETFQGLYFLSNLDQTFPYPIEIVFTYKPNGGNIPTEKAAGVIKESLAKILVKFYPLAGCLTVEADGKMHVRCTGEGVPFVEATSDNTLEELGDVSIVDPIKMRQLVHYVDGVTSILEVPLITVQVTKFRCGGTVVGIAMNHVLFDGIALADFLNSWAEITRGLPLSHEPNLNPSVFSPRQPPVVDRPHPEYVKLENLSQKNPNVPDQQEPLVFQSFCFQPKNLKKLKQLAKGNDTAFKSTSFEIISALMWVLRTKALKIESHKTTKLLTATDVRERMQPPVPERYLGNGIVWSCAECKAGELVKRPFSYAVKVVHEAIKDVTDDYIRSAIDYYQVTRGGLETENTCWITKWSRLPFYDVDFGWGAPEQVAPVSVVWNLAVVLSQAKDRENMVMTMGLPESVMETFQEMLQAELE